VDLTAWKTEITPKNPFEDLAKRQNQLILFSLSFCGPNYRMRVNTDCSCYGHKLRRVESPFPEFELRNERLALSDPLPELGLCQSGILTSLHEQLDHASVEVGTD
jgi:hypothetical protein